MPWELVGADELIVGADDFDGFGDVEDILSGYDLVGARYGLPFGRQAPQRGGRAMVDPQRARYLQALQMAAAAKQAQAGTVVRQQQPTKARKLWLPIASTGTVAANATVTITARPQSIAYRPMRIIVPPSIAPDFDIADIKVGNVSQFVQAGSIPAESFLPDATDSEMEMDTVQTSQDFVLQVTNTSGVARNFKASIIGRSVSQ